MLADTLIQLQPGPMDIPPEKTLPLDPCFVHGTDHRDAFAVTGHTGSFKYTQIVG